ncbi:hypothetical protein RND71_035520 [Anisodus tanguticus]|uniref:Uncharacterized protein n=1 Tax=Anisodus tanguticus TaxID=243964 RepID=A0AAE1R4E6_9SOLA|nr:hypothetical protein RND71_035520 [Anisodus tanguticus]
MLQDFANRQSTATSRGRKMSYIAELERKVQALQTEATSSIIQLILLKRETSARTAEISEFKLRLQTMEQRVHFQEALDDALKEEIQQLKVRIAQDIAKMKLRSSGSSAKDDHSSESKRD